MSATTSACRQSAAAAAGVIDDLITSSRDALLHALTRHRRSAELAVQASSDESFQR